MKNLKTVKILLIFFALTSCKNKSVREDILHKYPNYKIDTLLTFDFDKNQIPDNICVLDILPNKQSKFDNKQSIILYMNNKFISKNDNVIPNSNFGWEHRANFENKNNELIINDEFSTVRPMESYRLVFNYNKNLNKVVLDSFNMYGRIEDEKGMPYYKNFIKKKISDSIILPINSYNFLNKDSLSFKNF